MCGITGLINFSFNNKVSYSTLRKMTNLLNHRGPDSQGIWMDGSVGIGHTRLSIIDLSKLSNQPMLDEQKRFVISYNGEIYNFQNLKRRLLKKNYSFKTKGDTEVVLKSFIEWGPKAFSLFNGMFSLAIWDKKDKKLFLARDRYGIKPLYYIINESFFAFSSEIKSLKIIPKFEIKLNKETLYEYFTFQNIFSNKTFLKNIFLFPVGTYATIDFLKKKNNINFFQYWDFNFNNDSKFNISIKEYEEETLRLLTKAVESQLVTDRKIGSYLSGGIDSSSITALASKKITNLNTFTCGFDTSSASGIELSFDERNKAEYLSYKFNTEHFETVLKAGDMEKVLSEMIYYLDEPKLGQSYPNFYIAKLASKFVNVILSGIGGDELFAGYPWRYYLVNKKTSFDDYADNYYYYWQRLLNDFEITSLFSPIKNEVNNISTKDIFKNVFKNNDESISSKGDSLNRSLYFEAKTFLHSLLVIEDKLSMAHSLETRVPFLDNDLVDFISNCPAIFKLKNINNINSFDENIQNKYKRRSDGKILLRQSLKNILPKRTVNSFKQGFSSPDSSWFKGESINYVKNKLINKNALIYDYFEKKEVSKLLNQHFKGYKNRRLLIWSLLNFEEYLLQF